MSKIQLAIFSVLVLAAIVIPVMLQHESQVQLRHENEALRQELIPLARLTAENQRLSNVVAQAKVALGTADDRFQELLKLRAEVIRLNQENQGTNRLDQVKIAQNISDQLRDLSVFRSEVTGLSKEISRLREELRQVPATTAVAAPVETPVEPAATPTPAPSRQEQPLVVRMIDTQGEAFAEKLKRSVAAQEGESFQDVFGRFLQVNGVDVTGVAGFGYNERTGKVIVRATQTTLDQIEKLTVALDRAQ